MIEKTMTLLLLRRDDKILLAMKKRGFGEGRWNGIGGKVEAGESVEQAVIREAEEEIGMTPSGLTQIALLHFDEFMNGEPALMHAHVFEATAWTGEPTESDEMRPQWFALGDIPYDDMWSTDRYWLPQVLAGQKVIGDFTLNESDEVTTHTITEVTEFSV